MFRGAVDFSPYVVPSLFAALIISGVTQIAFMSDLYVGAPYAPSLDRLLPMLLFSPIIAIPGMIFGMLIVWPTALLGATITGWIAHRMGPRRAGPGWPLAGALFGMAALYGYSFLLGLGQARLGYLLINGAICGVSCAALIRRFAGPDVDDRAAGANDESADRIA